MPWGVEIGKYCHIAKGLTIYSHNHNWKSEEYIPYDDANIKKPVVIGDCVWIGCNVTIAPGAKIGDGVRVQLYLERFPLVQLSEEILLK